MNKIAWHVMGACIAGMAILEVVAFQKPNLEMKWFKLGFEAGKANKAGES